MGKFQLSLGPHLTYTINHRGQEYSYTKCQSRRKRRRWGGRQPGGAAVVVPVRLDPKVLDLLDAYARREDVTRRRPFGRSSRLALRPSGEVGGGEAIRTACSPNHLTGAGDRAQALSLPGALHRGWSAFIGRDGRDVSLLCGGLAVVLLLIFFAWMALRSAG